MGYRDYKLALSVNQTVSADADSEYYIDTEQTIPGWERGMPAAIVVNVETAPGGSTGINFLIVHKITEPTTADATLATFRVLSADLVKGRQLVFPLPGGVALLKMVRLYYDLIAADETSGVFSAYFTPLPFHSTP